MDGVDEAAELRLTAEQLAGEVADMRDADLGRLYAGGVQRPECGGLDQLIQPVRLLGEVGLVATEDVHGHDEAARSESRRSRLRILPTGLRGSAGTSSTRSGSL